MKKGKRMTLYCDLDGVLVDFNEGVKDITGLYPNQFRNVGQMWKQLAASKDFYYHLRFMPDGRELWDSIKEHKPTILTGLPLGKWAGGQKVRWVGDNLGWHVPIITCMSKEKFLHCNPGDILIDDRQQLQTNWENAGGVFVHHTDTESTLQKLSGVI